ncbi:hypothetical protein MUDAN_MDHGFNIF_01721 [Lactiplantibacillus mudanjiangensis]|uniref:Uncharacterized protein n=1 Tax=Lactiplantibacillus mudanjiangensis TaxID=1296538 RepID=A0A660E441_9LACO|nr:hypothetical protein MUDAN_IGPPGNFN_02459 [Lactiplantibacillus mudanjiangensis]VDG30168.1 hypothetical protein MUDAN_MDHGFNIF_01721 [Lactiplantibacillus mudanjiangensis]
MGLLIARFAGYTFATSMLSIVVFILLFVFLGKIFLSDVLGIVALLISFVIVRVTIKIK